MVGMQASLAHMLPGLDAPGLTCSVLEIGFAHSMLSLCCVAETGNSSGSHWDPGGSAPRNAS